MNAKIRRREWMLCMMASASAWPLVSRADSGFPAGPVTLVVPFSAGGQFDAVARLVAKAMSANLGQPVIIDNVGGAGGNIAGSRIARARPDGETLLMYGGNLAVARSLYKKLDYDPIEDFAPISCVSIAPHIIMASKASGITRLAQLKERSKASKLSYGSPGVGTSMHLAMEMVKDRFGLDVLHVPYKGGANVMTDLIGGQIDLGIIAVGPALPFIRNAKVVPLAVTSAKRSPALPQVPAIAELGQPDVDAGSWSGLVAPRKTPPQVIARLNESVRSALAAPEVRKIFDEEGFVAIGNTPAQMDQYIRGEAKRYAPLIAKLNLAS